MKEVKGVLREVRSQIKEVGSEVKELAYDIKYLSCLQAAFELHDKAMAENFFQDCV